MAQIKDIETVEEFNSVIENAGDRLVVADFWASWCGPCRQMGPAFDKMSEEDEFASVVFIKIDVDELGELAEEYGLQVMPTFMLFKNGKKLDECAGSNKEHLRQLVVQYK